MKKQAYLAIGILLIINLFILPGYCLAEPLIPVENQVILDKGLDYFTDKQIWKPTEDDTKKALSAIIKFLKNPKKESIRGPQNHAFQQRESKNIHNNFSNFNVQFVGIISNGKRRIYCNFFPSREEDNWKKHLVIMLDGGFWYWQIEYDIETGKCLNFVSNGYA